MSCDQPSRGCRSRCRERGKTCPLDPRISESRPARAIPTGDRTLTLRRPSSGSSLAPWHGRDSGARRSGGETLVTGPRKASLHGHDRTLLARRAFDSSAQPSAVASQARRVRWRRAAGVCPLAPVRSIGRLRAMRAARCQGSLVDTPLSPSGRWRDNHRPSCSNGSVTGPRAGLPRPRRRLRPGSKLEAWDRPNLDSASRSPKCETSLRATLQSRIAR